MESAFFEAGLGSYDTNRAYGGGGVHMHYKWDSDTMSGLYAETSLRVNHNKSNFYADEILE